MSFFASYLSRSRHGVYYMRYPLPLGFHPEGKRDYIRLSLGTHSPKLAKAYTGYLRFIAEGYVKQLEKMPMRYVEKKETIQTFFKVKLEERKRELDDNGPMPEKQIKSYREGLSLYEDIEKAGSIGTYTFDEPRMLDFFASRAIELPVEGDQRAALIADYNRAHQWLIQSVIEYSMGLSSFQASQPLLNASQSVAEASAVDLGLPLCEVMEKYFLEHRNGWKAKTLSSYSTYRDFLLEHMGALTPIRSCDMSSARKVKEALAAEPRATKTKNEYLAFGFSFFKWSRINGYSTLQLFEGLSFKPDKSEEKKRAFTPAELRAIEAEVLRQKPKLARSRYWCTLIGLYTGARLNEVSQLRAEDIYQDEHGWVIRLTDEGDGLSLKTDAAKRIVPMHSRLIELGLPAYAELCVGDDLFSDLAYAPEGQRGRKVSRWFNEVLLVRLGIKSKKVDFHSLRRSMITLLLQADVEEQKVKAIVGHKQEGVTQGYNTGGYTQRQKREALEKFKLEPAA